ncbi:ATP-dependent DNA helicase 2 subunit KU70-like isoform X2 [Populus alba]|uniref:ATP-dependent DNA helicase 2 subunit KU70-like isoform X2 n=1 Tax=Populus alba TaxID=43335 RepID=UPI003CC70F1B
MDEDDMPEINDETLLDEEAMARAFEEFKLSIYGDNDDEESAIGNGKANDAAKKKKPVAENAAKESANYNWPDLTDNGHDTGVSPLYRAVKGLKLLGTKSASIVP